MKKNVIHFEEIFKLLKNELKNKEFPNASRIIWKKVINTPFTTLISCILSLRTKDEVTDKASIRLLKKYNTPEKIIKLSAKKIESLIYPVGFYKTKSKRIIEISKTLIKNYNGKVPDDFNELLKLKGVGRKTANIVMLYGYKKKDFLPIDSHCHQIVNRLGWIKTKTPNQTELALKKILPKKYWNDFNHLFVGFGQTICVPISPFCSKCPIEKFCKKVGVTKSR
ncbi:MAG: endonuclease III [Candidatus Thermoplasmatota archaeon]|jgi:endonuclease-3|nr:endonuclease III [Candidatus Thermoplasmatota archaeon]